MSITMPSIRARPRLAICLVILVVLALVLPGVLPLSTRLLSAWDASVLVYLALVSHMALRADETSMRRRAALEDEGAVVILLLTVAAAVASFAAIAFEFVHLGDSPVGRGFHLALALLTIVCSWLLTHVSFALHYAHEYYADDGVRGGLRFPTPKDVGNAAPDYWDFLYFAANLGAAAQTSDVAIEGRRMRRIVLGHTFVSFLFNTTVLALGVNIAASLVSAP